MKKIMLSRVILAIGMMLVWGIYGVTLFVASSDCSAESYPTNTATPLATDLSMNQYKLYDMGDIITKGPWVDVRAYASFSAAVDAIGTSKKTLLIPNQQNITANKTVPSNITLKFLQGGSLNISNAVTVTINGQIDAGLYQIFEWTGTGKVVFGVGSTKELYSEWWGAKGDLSTDDATAIQAAINASSNVTPVVLLNKGYKANTQLTMTTNFQKLKGQGVGSVIWGNHTGYVLQVGEPTETERVGITVEELYLWSPTGKGLNVTHTNKSKFTNLWAWSSGPGYTIQELSILDTFTNLHCSSNLLSHMQTMYPLLPTVASSDVGIWVDRPTLECNALTFISPVVEGVGSHGIKITGTHVVITLINPSSEGNAGWGYYFDGITGTNGDLSVINGYAEANTLGALYAANQIKMRIDGGTYGAINASTDKIELLGVSFSEISNIGAYSLKADIGTLPNATDKYAAGSFNKYSNVLVGGGGLTGTSLAYSNTLENVYQGYDVPYLKYKTSRVHIGELNTFIANDTTPTVYIGNNYKTANTTATVYSNFVGGRLGQTIKVFIRDANTTVDFTGTNLKGNAGVDWSARSEDWMECFFDGTNWYCSVHPSSDLLGSIVWDPALLNDGAGATSSAITVTGAALGNYVLVSAPYDLQGTTVTAYVSAANTVNIRLQNESGAGKNLASGTWKVKVIK